MNVRLKAARSTKCIIIIKDVAASILNFLHNLERTNGSIVQIPLRTVV